MRKVILTTGGTGGHIFPALAVAEQLRAHGADVLFLGSEYGVERRLATQAGIPFRGLPVRGVLGRGIRSLGAAWGLLKAVGLARGILKEYQPDVVAGFGAYASFAPLIAAKLAGIPITVHEQNAMPGMTNRVLSRLATRVFLSLPDTGKAFQTEKCLLTGNPVREVILATGSAPRRPAAKHLLVMGGSQGARAINSLVLASLTRLYAGGVTIRHQAGMNDLDRVRAGYQAHGFDPAVVTPFIDDMASAYTWADLVLCRAGATSVAELAVAGKPAILIPFPYATHDHQTSNARVMSDAGAALLIPEARTAQEDMGGILLGLLQDAERLEAMAAAASRCARPDAAAQVARGILEQIRFEKGYV